MKAEEAAGTMPYSAADGLLRSAFPPYHSLTVLDCSDVTAVTFEVSCSFVEFLGNSICMNMPPNRGVPWDVCPALPKGCRGRTAEAHQLLNRRLLRCCELVPTCLTGTLCLQGWCSAHGAEAPTE